MPIKLFWDLFVEILGLSLRLPEDFNDLLLNMLRELAIMWDIICENLPIVTNC